MDDNYKPDNNTIINNKIRNNSLDLSPRHEITIESSCADNNISWNALKYGIDDNGTNTALSGNIYSDLIVGTAPHFIVDFQNISAAIAGAAPNDLLHVMAGNYPECVVVNKSVRLRGESRENTNISCASGTAVKMVSGADGAQIANFTATAANLAMRAEDVSNITIEENKIMSNYALELYNVTNSTIHKNRILGISGSAFIRTTNYLNISYNFFSSKFRFWSGSIDNNLWMNNFTNEDDVYDEYYNGYCVFGLDNSYNESREGQIGLSCIEDFLNYFNDSAIYQNETMLFSVDTSPGESNYTQINATINGTNCTLALTGGDSVHGIWTCEFNETGELGTYNATMLYYLEEDGDSGNRAIENTDFTVTELNMSTGLSAETLNVTDS